MSSARFSFSSRGKPSIVGNAKVIAMMPLDITSGTSQAEVIIRKAKMISNQLGTKFSMENNVLAWLPVKLKDGTTVIKTENFPAVKDDIGTLIIVTNGGEQAIEESFSQKEVMGAQFIDTISGEQAIKESSSKEEVMGAQFIDTVAANLNDDLELALTKVSRIIFVSDYSYRSTYASKLQKAFDDLKVGVKVEVCRSFSVPTPKEQISQDAVLAAMRPGR